MATLFDEDFLRKLEYLYIVSRRIFAGRLRAERRSKTIGSGLEFADHRDYAPGDDPRYLDWNVVGRMDRLLVRLFEEEEDLYVHLLVDASRSMAVGNPAPFDYARQIAAALAYIALANLDRVAVVPFAGTASLGVPPPRGKSQIYKIFRFLDGVALGGVTSFARSFDAFVGRARHTGLAVVLSDFFDADGVEGGLKRLQGAGFEVFAIHTHLPAGRPADARLGGEVSLVDAETGRLRRATLTAGTIRRHDAAFRRLQENLARFCLSRRIGFIRAPVNVPFERAILDVFRRGGFLK